MEVIFNSNRNFKLTNGRTYTVQRETADFYYVINDNNNVQRYAKNLFQIIGANEPQPVQEVQETPEQRRVREEQEELARRGRVRTEQDIIESVVVINIPINNSRIKYKVIYDVRERINDEPSLVEYETSIISINYNDSFSCGVNRLESIQLFLESIHNMIDYQEGDFDDLRRSLFSAIGNLFQDELDNMHVYRNAAFEMCSVITNNLNEVDYRHELTTHFGFTQAGPNKRNPNSMNDICILVRARDN